MRTASKTSALIIVLIIALSSLTVLATKPAAAETIPPPSVPQFTVHFINASYGITTANPYTGENQTQQVSNCSIQISIKNQLNYPSNYQIYYSIRIKPHFDGNWSGDGSLSYENGWFGYRASTDNGYALFMSGFTAQSNNSYTVITYTMTPTSSSEGSGYDIQLTPIGDSGSGSLPAIPYGGQLDFQVAAIVGHNSTYWITNADLPPPQIQYFPAIAYDSNSTWSSTQTVTIGQTSTPSWASPTCESPALPAWSWLIALSLLIAAILIAVALKYRETKHRLAA